MYCETRQALLVAWSDKVEAFYKAVAALVKDLPQADFEAWRLLAEKARL